MNEKLFDLLFRLPGKFNYLEISDRLIFINPLNYSIMKRLFTFCIALFSVTFLYAQADILLDDFESGAVSFTTTVNVNPAASMDQAVVDNPVKAGIDVSNKAWQWKRFDATPDVNQPWAGFYATLKNPIPTGYVRIEIKYMRTNATSQLRIKCEGAVSSEIASVTPATKTNEWELMVYDLTVPGIKNITTFGIFPDYNVTSIDPMAISYVDDIKIIYGTVVVPPPTNYILFANSADNRFRDESYVAQTAPSTVFTENFDPLATGIGDKLPVVTSPVKSLPNALKLDWKSVAAGSWAAMTAADKFAIMDLRTFTDLKFWLNSAVALPAAALPMLYIEAGSGTPNVTGKLLLATYLPTGLVANTWTEVTIPLADFWAADPTFTAKDLIKDVFFSQNAADNVEHTMFMDDFTFINANAAGVDVLKTNPLNAYYTNGELRISDYSGVIRVYDLIGKNVFEGTTSNGNLRVNLKNGIYIINTTRGNSKISIQ